MKPVKNLSHGVPYIIGDIITPSRSHSCTYQILNLEEKACDQQDLHGCKICYNNQKLARLHCLNLKRTGWYCLQLSGHPWVILERKTNETRQE